MDEHMEKRMPPITGGQSQEVVVSARSSEIVVASGDGRCQSNQRQSFVSWVESVKAPFVHLAFLPQRHVSSFILHATPKLSLSV